MKLLKDTVSYLSSLVSSFFFVFAVLCFNSEGTTWGSGPAILGLFLMVPSFLVMLKFSNFKKLKFSRAAAFVAAFISLVITLYTFVDTKIKLRTEHLSDGPTQFYPPDLSFQVIGLLAICYMFYVIYASSKSKNNDGSVRGSA